MISVCMATYNGEKYIKTQLDSILGQLKETDEIIISDDSSTDQTLDILRNYNDSRIKVYPNQKFRNPIFNFENAINHAKGDYIFLSDQDDKWEKNKIQHMLRYLETYDLVVSDATIGDENLVIIKNSYFEWRSSQTGILKNFIKNSYLGCCMAFNRKVLTLALPFPKQIPMHDMWIGMVAEFCFKSTFIPQKLMIYRRHGGNATFLKDDFSSNETFATKLRFRMNLFLAIVKRMIKHNLK